MPVPRLLYSPVRQKNSSLHYFIEFYLDWNSLNPFSSSDLIQLMRQVLLGMPQLSVVSEHCSFSNFINAFLRCNIMVQQKVNCTVFRNELPTAVPV
jgi:hypothetical protein